MTAPYDVLSGGGFLIGSLFAIAAFDAKSGATVEGTVIGVFDITKTAGVAAAQGALAYWDDSAKSITSTSSGNKLVGVFAQAAASADATGRIKLTGAFTQ